ncbi:MAG: YfhO family protein [Acidobacteriota bacterium]
MPESRRGTLHRFVHKCRGSVIPMLTFLLFFALQFRQALFGGRFLLVGDPLKELYPLRMIAWGMIRSGKIPLWTPYILGGYPMFSMVMLGIGYPVTWGYLFLPGHWAEQIYVLAPYALAPLFTYAWLRAVGRTPIAALLGGLVYGYGGFMLSPIGLTGVHTNSALWLPLLLLGVTKSQRRGSFGAALFLTTAACTMAILGGSGQITIYITMVAGAYAAFLAIFSDDPETQPARRRLIERLRPMAVLGGAVLLSFGLTAFQTVETWNAVGLSVRRAYPIERFSEGSFPPSLAWRSLLEPIDNFWDSSTYVPLLALGLALIAVVAARRVKAGPQVFFWSLVALTSWLLVLGNHTGLFKHYAHLPLVKRFRYPSRHSLEWSFAVGVLAAYGWDVVESMRTAMRSALEPRPVRRSALIVAAGSAFILLAGLLAIRWSRQIVANGLDQVMDINNFITRLHYPYLGWKLAFTLSIVAALWMFRGLASGSVRTTLLAVAIALSCFVEPYLWLMQPIALRWSVPVEQFGSFGTATRALQKMLGRNERSFSVIHPYSVSTEPVRDADAVNWTVLAGIQEVNGYESLILERFSYALRDGPGAGDAEPFVRPDPALLEPRSLVLDLLNVHYVTAYGNFGAVPTGETEKDGIKFSSMDLGVELASDGTCSLSAGGVEGDTLVLVSAMAVSGNVRQGASVAHITIHGVDGRVVERELRAGFDTSEWAHERADVKANVQHGLAPVFDSNAGDAEGMFLSHRYVARIALGARFPVARVEMVKVPMTASVGLSKVSLYDSELQRSMPLPQPSPSRWRRVYDQNGVTILRNLRALPRAWLVTKAQVLEKDEILRRIRGQSRNTFDPRSTALVESPNGMPSLPGGALTAESDAAVVSYEPCRIVLRSSSPQRTMLVVSEMFYPGWVARVDGAATPIQQTDYLLRGVFLEPGKHTIEMAYQAPGARRGAAVSIATLALIGVLWFRSRGRRSSKT